MSWIRIDGYFWSDGVDRRTFIKLVTMAWAGVNFYRPRRRARTSDPSGIPNDSSGKPNVLLIVTDDQQKVTLRHMPRLRAKLAQAGTSFERAYVADPVCAPARASILTGRYVHNHGIKENQRADQRMRETGVEDDTLATRLQAAGYATALLGKYQNNYDRLSIPPGWDRWWSFLSPYNDRSAMYFNANGEKSTISRQNWNECDYLARLAKGFVRTSDKPWLLAVCPHSPHGPYMPAQRHANMFSSAALPKPPNFDEADVNDKPRNVQRLPRLSRSVEGDIRDEWRGTLREVQDVDDLVASLIDDLQATGQLENTLILYTTDNGYPYGEHRFTSSKGDPYEEQMRIPFVARGPGVAAGAANNHLVSQVDILPTILDAAGSPHDDLDGSSLMPLLRGEGGWERDALLVDHYMHGEWHAVVERERIYTEYDTGESELYDLATDPYQLRSKHDDSDWDPEAQRLSLLLAALQQQ